MKSSGSGVAMGRTTGKIRSAKSSGNGDERIRPRRYRAAAVCRITFCVIVFYGDQLMAYIVSFDIVFSLIDDERRYGAASNARA